MVPVVEEAQVPALEGAWLVPGFPEGALRGLPARRQPSCQPAPEPGGRAYPGVWAPGSRREGWAYRPAPTGGRWLLGESPTTSCPGPWLALFLGFQGSHHLLPPAASSSRLSPALGMGRRPSVPPAGRGCCQAPEGDLELCRGCPWPLCHPTRRPSPSWWDSGVGSGTDLGAQGREAPLGGQSVSEERGMDLDSAFQTHPLL